MTKKKLRPLGDILLEAEPLLEEMVDAHRLQRSDFTALFDVWFTTHRESSIEEYLDGSRPVPVLYAHEDEVLLIAKKILSNRKKR
jgi:hypothetical protein